MAMGSPGMVPDEMSGQLTRKGKRNETPGVTMMADLKRVQRTRVKGGGMPEGAVYVGRPTKWGNPFFHAQQFLGLDVALKLYRNTVTGMWNPALLDGLRYNPTIAYDDHCRFIERFTRFGESPLVSVRLDLRGHDLACWCPLDRPCHADILLEIANA